MNIRQPWHGWHTGAAGVLIVSMVLTCVLQDVSGSDWVFAERWIPGMLGWMAAVLLVDKIKSAQRWQIATIAGLGLAMHAVALSRGVEIDVSRAVGINASLISMIAAVGFLRLVVNPGAANEKLPTGNRPTTVRWPGFGCLDR